MFYEEDGFHLTIDQENQYPPDLNLLNWRFENIIKPFARKISGSKVLDIGTHNGQWAFASLKLGAKFVTGIDKEQKYIDRARLNIDRTGFTNYVLIRCDAEEYKFEPYDFITCMNVLYFVQDIEFLFSRLRFKLMILDTFINHGTIGSKEWLEKKMSKYMCFKEIQLGSKPHHYFRKSVYVCVMKRYL